MIFIALDRASGKYLNEIYMEAWRLGLKSTYYLRSQSPEEIKSTESVEDRSIECVGCQQDKKYLFSSLSFKRCEAPQKCYSLTDFMYIQRGCNISY